jgi:hypothetical protein
VTRQRLYLETIERLFGGTDKIIIAVLKPFVLGFPGRKRGGSQTVRCADVAREE